MSGGPAPVAVATQPGQGAPAAGPPATPTQTGAPAQLRGVRRPLWQSILPWLATLWLVAVLAQWAAPAVREAYVWARIHLHLA